MYILSQLHLVEAPQKSPDISSDAIAASRLTHMAALSPSAAKTMAQDGMEQPFYHECMDFIAKLLRKPNGGYEEFRDQLYLRVNQEVDTFLARAAKAPLDLHEWVRHEVIMVMAGCMYGDEHPFKDSSVEHAFW